MVLMWFLNNSYPFGYVFSERLKSGLVVLNDHFKELGGQKLTNLSHEISSLPRLNWFGAVRTLLQCINRSYFSLRGLPLMFLLGVDLKGWVFLNRYISPKFIKVVLEFVWVCEPHNYSLRTPHRPLPAGSIWPILMKTKNLLEKEIGDPFYTKNKF